MGFNPAPDAPPANLIASINPEFFSPVGKSWDFFTGFCCCVFSWIITGSAATTDGGGGGGGGATFERACVVVDVITEE